MTISFQRSFVNQLAKRLRAESVLIQVLVGPRQVGKATGVQQLISQYELNAHYANVDDLFVGDRSWLIEQWQQALLLGEGTLLVIYGIQKVQNWPETPKILWGPAVQLWTFWSTTSCVAGFQCTANPERCD